MDPKEQTFLNAETEVNAPIDKVWALWNAPEHITQWNSFSDEWHTPKAENDLRTGGSFLYVMSLKDGSFSFNFQGTYDNVQNLQLIAYTLDDGRQANISFTGSNPVKIIENFEPDKNQPNDMQKEYCQAVLDSFKKYVEANLS
jgi:uncharacterized protein YndB with AHSA1/START domain